MSGRRRGTFQINSRYLDKLDNEYGELLSIRQENVLPHILPIDFARGERPLEQLVVEVNGSYERGWYNSCAVMLRRILESLIVSVFIKKKKVDEIRIDGSFLMLEALIEKIFTINQLNMARGAKKIMSQIKEIGDVAAHNRTYLTNQQDIDDIKLGARRVLDELLQIIS